MSNSLEAELKLSSCRSSFLCHHQIGRPTQSSHGITGVYLGNNVSSLDLLEQLAYGQVGNGA